jgi:hypothetical protein
MTITRPDITAGLPESELSQAYALHQGDPPDLKVLLVELAGAECITGMSVCHTVHRQVHPRAGYPMIGPRRGVVMASWNMTIMVSSCAGQQ